MADVVFKAAQQHTGAKVCAHVDPGGYPGPELVLSDQVVELMGRQFDSLDADGGGSIEKHEVPPAIWKELDTHFNKDGDFEIDRNEYMTAVKESILGQVVVVVLALVATTYPAPDPPALPDPPPPPHLHPRL
jgi:hypothetical protein